MWLKKGQDSGSFLGGGTCCVISVLSLQRRMERRWKEAAPFLRASASLYFNQNYFCICLQALFSHFKLIQFIQLHRWCMIDILYHSRVGYLLFFLMYIKVFYSVTTELIVSVYLCFRHNTLWKVNYGFLYLKQLFLKVFLKEDCEHHCIASSAVVLRESHFHGIRLLCEVL